MFLTMPRQTERPDHALAQVFVTWRDRSGRTQEDVAFHAGITTGTLARIELAQSSPEWMTVRNIARALDIPLSELGAEIEVVERGRDRLPAD
jgi:transcriptional regulator with XRE-family HTH domain